MANQLGAVARDSREYPLSPRPYFVLYGIYGKRLYEHRLAIEPDDLFTVLVLIYLPYLFKLQLSVRYCTEQTAGYGTRWYPSGPSHLCLPQHPQSTAGSSNGLTSV